MRRSGRLLQLSVRTAGSRRCLADAPLAPLAPLLLLFGLQLARVLGVQMAYCLARRPVDVRWSHAPQERLMALAVEELQLALMLSLALPLSGKLFALCLGHQLLREPRWPPAWQDWRQAQRAVPVEPAAREY